ncbi:MAG: enoyl-CoA hydratase/isomerase family protein [Firmicutes bacterium]|nr:enoyl-CoA hydratase/isomerase family protein [Bacillota bacterium]
MSQIIARERDQCVEIVIQNPRYYNCLTRQMWGQLEAIARDVSSRQDIRAVIVRGEGHHFSSGYDLDELGTLSYEEVNQSFALMERAISAVESIPVPVIGVLQGYCLGGAFELALACDIRLGDSSVRMGMPIARIGIMLSHTFASRLVRELGLPRSKILLFTGRLLTADQGERYGLLAEVYPDPSHLEAGVREWVRDIHAQFPRALNQAKASLHEVSLEEVTEPPYFVDSTDFFTSVQRFRHARDQNSGTSGS